MSSTQEISRGSQSFTTQDQSEKGFLRFSTFDKLLSSWGFSFHVGYKIYGATEHEVVDYTAKGLNPKKTLIVRPGTYSDTKQKIITIIFAISALVAVLGLYGYFGKMNLFKEIFCASGFVSAAISGYIATRGALKRQIEIGKIGEITFFSPLVWIECSMANFFKNQN